MASSYQRLLSWLRSGDSLQPEAPPERRRVAGQAPALSPQQPPRQRAGCERIIMVLVHAVPCDVRGAITGGLAAPPSPPGGTEARRHQPILGLDTAPRPLRLMVCACLDRSWSLLPAEPRVRPLVGHFRLAPTGT